MAMPGILQQIAKNSPMMGQIKQTISAIRTAQNPQAMINQLMMNNPNMKQAMELVNQYGGDPNKAFYETAKQMGINPQDVFDMMK